MPGESNILKTFYSVKTLKNVAALIISLKPLAGEKTGGGINSG
jgi:hypothetical protein